MLEVLKYLIQPVVFERDADGKIVREIPGETQSAYSLDQLVEMVHTFQLQVANHNAQGGGENAGQSGNGATHRLRQSELPGERPRSEGQDRLDVRDG